MSILTRRAASGVTISQVVQFSLQRPLCYFSETNYSQLVLYRNLQLLLLKIFNTTIIIPVKMTGIKFLILYNIKFQSLVPAVSPNLFVFK